MKHIQIPKELQGAHGSRTLALDPTYRGFAFCVLEGSERLIDWGIPQIRTRGKRRVTIRTFAARIDGLLDFYRPDLVVLESPKVTARQKKAVERIELIALRAEIHAVPVIFINRDDVRLEFHASGGRKYDIAVALAQLFPELERRLPRQRKLWTAEDERMSIFDALSFAITALRHIEWRS